MKKTEPALAFPITLYCVYDRTSYKYFPTGRYDVEVKNNVDQSN